MDIMAILTTGAWILSLVVTIYILYFSVTSLFALKKRGASKSHEPQHRFVCFVAARNEEQVIGHLVDSLKSQNYPEHLYKVIVVPNNCTDNTKAVALRHGADIMECTIQIKSKGDVLAHIFPQIMDSDFHADAICVFDADNLVDPNYLSEMNNAICGGASIAQGYRDSKNPHDTAVSGQYSIYYWMANRFLNHSRSALGLSATINGSGFMVRCKFLKKMGGWNTLTMTEDIEFTAQCALAGERVEWVPNAIVYDEQPLTFSQSWTQRKRWSAGILQGCRIYAPKLLKNWITTGNKLSLDQFMFFLAPVFQVLCLFSGLLGLMLDVLSVKYMFFPTSEIYQTILLSMGISYTTSFMTSLVAVLLEKKLDIRMAKGIISYWIFVFSWIPITMLCMVKKHTVWDQIKHSRSVELSQVAKR